MHYDENSYEASIDFSALIAALLRKWKWLLVMIAVCAAALGISQALKPPTIVVSNKEIKNLQEQQDDIRATINTNAAAITTNMGTITANETAIDSVVTQMVSNQEKLPELHEEWLAARTAYVQAQEVLANPDSTLTDRAGIITNMTGLVNTVNARYNEYYAVVNQIDVAKADVSTRRTQNADLEAQNKDIAMQNASLAAQIAQLDGQIAGLRLGTPVKDPVLPSVWTGVAVGAAVYCCVIFILFMANRKLRGARELKERYHMIILGELYSEKAAGHKKFGQALDKLSGDVQTAPDAARVYELIAASIQAVTKGEPVHLAVTGTVEKSVLDDVSGKLQALLPDGYEVTAHENPVYNAEFLIGLRNFSILLVESKGISDKREIQKMAELLSRSMANVLGAVVR